jgi:hypothetical protein
MDCGGTVAQVRITRRFVEAKWRLSGKVARKDRHGLFGAVTHTESNSFVRRPTSCDTTARPYSGRRASNYSAFEKSLRFSRTQISSRHQARFTNITRQRETFNQALELSKARFPDYPHGFHSSCNGLRIVARSKQVYIEWMEATVLLLST